MTDRDALLHGTANIAVDFLDRLPDRLVSVEAILRCAREVGATAASAR